MGIRKNIIPILVVILLFNLVFSPSIGAESPKNPGDTLTIWMPDITEDDYFVQIKVSKEEKHTFYDKLNTIFEAINSSTSIDSPEGKKITMKEWENITISLNDFINSIKLLDENFPNVDTKQLVSDIIDAFFNPLAGFLPPEPVISIGSGFTWIPFYGYESFFGMMLRPMFTRHILGFTKIGGLISTYTKFGTYSMITIGFTGLFINFGDIGFDRILGPTIYIGSALFVRT